MLNPIIAAGADLSQFVVIAIAALVTVISTAIKSRNQQAQMEKERARKKGITPENEKEPAKELERFLNELTDQRKKTQKPATQPARRPSPDPRLQQRRPTKPAKAPPTPIRPIREPELQRGSQVLHRHLSSALEQRHQESMHSDLQRKHLKSDVTSRHLAAMDSKGDAPLSKSRPEINDALVTDLIPRDANGITRAFIFSQIFGPPTGLR